MKIIKTKKKGRTNMSPKELLYIEDSLAHEKQIKDVCTAAQSTLQDSELKNFVQDLCTKLQTNYNRIYGVL